MTTLMNSNNVGLQSGLLYSVYNGGYGENPNYFSTATLYTPRGPNQGFVTGIPNIIAGTNNCINSTSTQGFSVQWLGYFKSDYTGTWTFQLQADDSAFLWIGDNAITGFTNTNQLVYSYWPSVPTGTINLQANTYYPIRIQMGNRSSGGGTDLVVSFSNPTLTIRTDGTGYFFYKTGNFKA